jgi:opacity protein-like surface antigen
MKRATFLVIPVFLFLFSTPSMAQNLRNLGVGGGWAYVSSNFGVNGFNVGADYWFTPRVSGVFSYDYTRNTSNLGTFEITSIGQIAIKSHLQNYLFGPRIAFAKKNIKKYQFIPFAEVQIGGTYLRSEVQQPSTGLKQTASANGFSWMLGGGADYVFSDHWAARVNLDFLRSHLANAGQSQLRLVIGVAYSFQSRNR